MSKRNLVLALALVGLMFTAVERAQAEPLVALQAFTSTDFLLRFDSATPETVARTGVSGLHPSDRLVGIDYRPTNGLLYGLANRFNPPTQENITSIYTIDPSTGVATFVSTLSTPLSDRSVIPRVGIDFDPVSDRLRVVNALNHQNLRINVDTGETVVDGSINPNS